MTIALPSTDNIEKATNSPKFDRKISNLGDGYVRLAATGINSVRDQWDIVWNTMIPADANSIETALLGTQGVETITWTPPDTVTSRNWYVSKVSNGYRGTVNKQVKATLVEKFI